MTSYSVILDYIKHNRTDRAIEALEDNIREEALKDSGRKVSDLTLIKRLLSQSTLKKEAHGFTYNGVIYYGFTDGHYILADSNDYGYEHSDGRLRFADMFKASIQDSDTEIMIDKADVKAFTKLHSKREKLPYIIEKNGFKLGLNPYFLLDCMEFTGADKIVFPKKTRKRGDFSIQIAPVALQGNGRLALILPICIN